MYTRKDIKSLLGRAGKLATSNSWGTTKLQLVGGPPPAYIKEPGGSNTSIAMYDGTFRSPAWLRGHTMEQLIQGLTPLHSYTRQAYIPKEVEKQYYINKDGLTIIRCIHKIDFGKSIIIDKEDIELLSKNRVDGEGRPMEGYIFVRDESFGDGPILIQIPRVGYCYGEWEQEVKTLKQVIPIF